MNGFEHRANLNSVLLYFITLGNLAYTMLSFNKSHISVYNQYDEHKVIGYTQDSENVDVVSQNKPSEMK